MVSRKLVWLLFVLVLVLAGCGSLPGLRVLTGQDTAEVESERVAETITLVMADKAGGVDASVLAAADRLEAAAGNVDVVQIQPNLGEDSLDIFMILRPSGDPTSDQLQDVLDYYNSIRRAVELTWQATLRESERFDFVRIEVLGPQVVPTLDKGPSFIAFIDVIVRIAREDAVDYLARPHNLDTFIELITSGKMSFKPPDSQSLYLGTPNHPLFMIPAGTGQ